MTIPCSVFDFCRIIDPDRVCIVHYSGAEDLKHYNKEILADTQLERWMQAEAREAGLHSAFTVPAVGDRFML